MLLVVGEFLAFLSAVVGGVLWLAGVEAPWLFIAAAIVSTAFLAGYAVNLVSQGELPLTPRFINRVKSIAQHVLLESRIRSDLPLRFDWDSPAVQEDGSISVEMSQASLREMIQEMAEGKHGEEHRQWALHALMLAESDGRSDTA